MGEMICAMGKDMQIFAITHLPQVAAKEMPITRREGIDVLGTTATTTIRPIQDKTASGKSPGCSAAPKSPRKPSPTPAPSFADDPLFPLPPNLGRPFAIPVESP